MGRFRQQVGAVAEGRSQMVQTGATTPHTYPGTFQSAGPGLSLSLPPAFYLSTPKAEPPGQCLSPLRVPKRVTFLGDTGPSLKF